MKLLRTVWLMIAIGLFSSIAFSQELPSLAVVDFDTTHTKYNYLGRQLAELIGDAVINSNLFDVVERDKLNTIIKEQSFSGSGMVDPNSAIQMGSMVGARYLMTGKVVSADVEKTSFTGYGVTTTEMTYIMKVSARVLDTKTGRVMFSGTETDSIYTQSTNSLRVSGKGAFVELAEKIAYSFVDRLNKSGKFKPEKKEELALVKVKFLSEPDTADVEVDGVFYGNAGGEIEVPEGLHTVRISLPGHDVWEKKVMLRKESKIIATLRKAADIRISHEEE